jgi:hypothetical protein
LQLLSIFLALAIGFFYPVGPTLLHLAIGQVFKPIIEPGSAPVLLTYMPTGKGK